MWTRLRFCLMWEHWGPMLVYAMGGRNRSELGGTLLSTSGMRPLVCAGRYRRGSVYKEHGADWCQTSHFTIAFQFSSSYFSKDWQWEDISWGNHRWVLQKSTMFIVVFLEQPVDSYTLTLLHPQQVFFRGITINAVRGFPTSSAMFLGYELSLKAMKRDQTETNP